MPIELLGKEVRFLVPTGRNTDKRGHEFEVWQWLDDAMNREFSAGWQQSAMLRVADRVSGGIKGRWFDKENDEAVVDNSVEYVVAISVERMPALIELFDQICTRFDQKCLYFASAGDAALYFPTTMTDPSEHE